MLIVPCCTPDNHTACRASRRNQILVQFALGDLEVPNPTESAVVRAGNLKAATWLLRTKNRAAAIDPGCWARPSPDVPYPIYPHRFLSNPALFRLGPAPPLRNPADSE